MGVTVQVNAIQWDTRPACGVSRLPAACLLLLWVQGCLPTAYLAVNLVSPSDLAASALRCVRSSAGAAGALRLCRPWRRAHAAAMSGATGAVAARPSAASSQGMSGSEPSTVSRSVAATLRATLVRTRRAPAGEDSNGVE